MSHPTAFLRPVGLLPITLFGAFVLLAALPFHQGPASGMCASSPAGAS